MGFSVQAFVFSVEAMAWIASVRGEINLSIKRSNNQPYHTLNFKAKASTPRGESAPEREAGASDDSNNLPYW